MFSSRALRVALVGLISAVASISSASWTATILNPSGSPQSRAHDGDGNVQVGRAQDAVGHNLACKWTGTAASYVSLHPTWANESIIWALSGNKQGGTISLPTGTHAAIWSGTAASCVDLNPAVATGSSVRDLDATKQVGFAYVDGFQSACTWGGNPQSFVNLHPANCQQSAAYAMSGIKQGGFAIFNDVSKAALWSGSAASYTDITPTGAGDSAILCMTATKQGGYATIDGISHAGIWSGTKASFVDLHPGGAESTVNDMNDSMQVGYIYNGVQHAGLWMGTAASFVDLHSTLPAGYSDSVASAIASDAQYTYISGYAVDAVTGKTVAVVWKQPNNIDFTFTLNKSSVAGQNSVQGTLTLASAQATATTFATYDNSSLVTTPATVTVPASTTVKNFQITVTAVTSPINTLIYAKYGTITQSRQLTLAPLIPTALSFTPNPVSGGSSTVGKVVINGVAGPGGRTIALVDNSPNASMPSTVVVPAGASQVTFTIMTTIVTAVKNVTVTARVTAGEKTGTFRINP